MRIESSKTSFTAYYRRWMFILSTLVIPFLLGAPAALAGPAVQGQLADYVLNYKPSSENTPEKTLNPNTNKELVDSSPLAPCETLEIRVAANSGNELVFKEGVGSIFTVGNVEKRKYILTVAHLITYQKALIGICNNKFYELKPIALDTSIDTAVLEITNPDAGLSRLFNYQKGESPQIFEMDKFKATYGPDQPYNNNSAFATLLADHSLFIETIRPGLLRPRQRILAWNSFPQSHLEVLNRRVLLPYTKDGKLALDSVQTNIIPGNDYTYLLQLAGSKPGMSGSPVFIHHYLRPFHITGFDPEPIMVGIVSKTKINDAKTALVPFNIIYKNLDLLLSGQSNMSTYTSNDTLYVNGKTYQNAGGGDFKNSADEIEFSEEVQRQFSIKGNSSQKTTTLDFQYENPPEEKNSLEKLLRDPKQIPKSKRKSLERPGSDWGDGGGDLVAKATTENFVANSKYSIFIDPKVRENSGVIDSSGTVYYGLLKEEKFTQIKSVFSLLKYTTRHLDEVLKNNGVTDKTAAFKALCANPAWHKNESAVFFNKENNLSSDDILSYQPPITNQGDPSKSLYVAKNIYDYCLNNTLEVSIETFNMKARLHIGQDSMTGDIKFLGCSNKIKVSSKNIWERPLSASSFDGKLEIGDSEESLIKLDIFKIHRNCNPTSYASPTEAPWRTNPLLGTVNLWTQ